MEGELTGECCLSGTVKTGNEDYCRRTLEVDVRRFASHQGRKFIMHDLYDHLLRLHCSQHVLSDGLLLYVVAELLCDLVAHVGV